MPPETVRLSQQAKEQLIRVKRYTGIEHWNVLCRWAFCLSLQESSIPPDSKIVLDSNVEITWRVFGGTHHEVYAALLQQRCLHDNVAADEDAVAQQFRLHLHRGIAYLAGNPGLRSLRDLIGLVSTDE